MHSLGASGSTESEPEWSWILRYDSPLQSLECAVIIDKAWRRAHRVPLAVGWDDGIHSSHTRVSTEE